MHKPLTDHENNEKCNISLKELYNAMDHDEFKFLLETTILSDSELEFQSESKSLVLGVGGSSLTDSVDSKADVSSGTSIKFED